MLNFKTDFYAKLVQSLDNNSVLMRVETDGRYRPIWCSREYAEMMEGTEDECIRYEGSTAMNESVHPDDRDEVAYLFQNHRTRSGSNSMTIRKTTVKGNLIWVCVHYAFLEEDGVQYAYCTYFDVTELKESQQQTMAMYQELNKELDALSNESLAALRSNLTRGVVEEVHGRDLYDVDKPGAPISDLIEVRMANMPVASDRETYLKVFDLERLKEKYYLGERPTSLVIFSRRQVRLRHVPGGPCLVDALAGYVLHALEIVKFHRIPPSAIDIAIFSALFCNKKIPAVRHYYITQIFLTQSSAEGFRFSLLSCLLYRQVSFLS